jgi:DNA polymerase V
MSDIKKYRSKSHSVSFSQILPRDYDYEEAAVVMAEMAIHGCLELYKRHVITKKVWIGVWYSRYEQCPPAQGTIKLSCATQLSSIIEPAVKQKFREIVSWGIPIRNLAISFCDTRDEGCEGYDLFTDWEKVDKEKAVERTVLEIRDRFGKNAVLRGINLNKAGTQRERNTFIGGHRAGYDDERAARETVHAL